MIDDFNWRTRACKSLIYQDYKVGHDVVSVHRRCGGSLQFRRKGTSQWKCFLCLRHQIGEDHAKAVSGGKSAGAREGSPRRLKATRAV